MNKVLKIFVVSALAFSIAGCQNNKTEPTPEPKPEVVFSGVENVGVPVNSPAEKLWERLGEVSCKIDGNPAVIQIAHNADLEVPGFYEATFKCDGTDTEATIVVAVIAD